VTDYYANPGQVELLPGQTIGFLAGHGFYAVGTPEPAGGSATPVATQPSPAITPPESPPTPPTVGSASTQPVPSVQPPTYYYANPGQVELLPGQTIGFLAGHGFYAAGTPEPTPVATPSPVATAPAQPAPSVEPPTYYYANRGQVELLPGQTIGFLAGHGFYAAGTPEPTVGLTAPVFRVLGLPPDERPGVLTTPIPGLTQPPSLTAGPDLATTRTELSATGSQGGSPIVAHAYVDSEFQTFYFAGVALEGGEKGPPKGPPVGIPLAASVHARFSAQVVMNAKGQLGYQLTWFMSNTLGVPDDLTLDVSFRLQVSDANNNTRWITIRTGSVPSQVPGNFVAQSGGKGGPYALPDLKPGEFVSAVRGVLSVTTSSGAPLIHVRGGGHNPVVGRVTLPAPRIKPSP
jgi:hypothetical protein